MNVEPILRARMKLFKENFSLVDIENDDLFELFVNRNVLMPFSPEYFRTNTDLLDEVSVGKGQDMGIDGVAVLYNSSFVTTVEQVEDVKTNLGRDKVTFFYTV